MNDHEWARGVPNDRVALAQARVDAAREIFLALDEALWLVGYYRSRYELLRESVRADAARLVATLEVTP